MSGVLEQVRRQAVRIAAQVELLNVLVEKQPYSQNKLNLLDVQERLEDASKKLTATLALPAQAAAGAAGVHVISPERREGITPGMVEAAQRIARSVVRSESFSLELGEGVTLPAGRLRLTALKDGAGAFEFLPDAPEQP